MNGDRRQHLEAVSESTASPWTIRQQCSAHWESMAGDDKRRFCERCQRFVHNVSAMSREEREILALPENLKECVFYSRRRDGRIADFSFLARFRGWFPFLRWVGWSAMVTLIPALLSGCEHWVMGARCTPIPPPAPAPDNTTVRIQPLE